MKETRNTQIGGNVEDFLKPRRWEATHFES